MKHLFTLCFILLGWAATAQKDTVCRRVILVMSDSSVIPYAVETVVYVPPPPNCRCIGGYRAINYKTKSGMLISDNFKHDGKIKDVIDFYFKEPEEIWHH